MLFQNHKGGDFNEKDIKLTVFQASILAVIFTHVLLK